MTEPTKKVLTFASSISIILGATVALGVFLNLPLRPAWAWEVEELNTKQLEYQIEFYESQLNRINKELYLNKKEERDYIRNNEQVDEWVHNENRIILRDKQSVENKLKRAQQQLLDIKKR